MTQQEFSRAWRANRCWVAATELFETPPSPLRGRLITQFERTARKLICLP